MKMKHNKKRNTAFLYESLIKELTKTIVRKEQKQKNKIIEMLKKYFSKGTPLRKELNIYKELLETKSPSPEFTQRLMVEVKKDYLEMDRKLIFNLQTTLIKEINESLSNKIFANFISNYKNIASVGQYFNSDSLPAKNRLLIENNIASILLSKPKESSTMKHIDNLTYNTFVKRFNESYENSLRPEQKKLLTNYITSFSDNGLQLKVYMNEEMGRLKKELSECIGPNSNQRYVENCRQVLRKLEGYSSKPIDEGMVKNLFYIQDLLHEVKK